METRQEYLRGGAHSPLRKLRKGAMTRHAQGEKGRKAHRKRHIVMDSQRG